MEQGLHWICMLAMAEELVLEVALDQESAADRVQAPALVARALALVMALAAKVSAQVLALAA